uniref:Uncharacterized protein n=1 Tax=Populus trichocarpa TaxID=3694 RepID=A0A3N7GP62_POPTR
MWAIGPHDIKLIFKRGGSATVACYWDPQASPMRCTTARAWRALHSEVKILFWALEVLARGSNQ